MSFLDFPGLQYFYNKYLKPIKPHAREETIKSYTVNEQGHVPDAQLVAQLKEENESLQAKVEALNSSLGGFKFIESLSTGDNGSTSITMTKNLEVENLYIIFVRNLNGSVECYAPYAYLFYIRSNSWQATTVGDPVDVDKISIQGGKFTISFKTNQWARMWVYKIS